MKLLMFVNRFRFGIELKKIEGALFFNEFSGQVICKRWQDALVRGLKMVNA